MSAITIDSTEETSLQDDLTRPMTRATERSPRLLSSLFARKEHYPDSLSNRNLFIGGLRLKITVVNTEDRRVTGWWTNGQTALPAFVFTAGTAAQREGIAEQQLWYEIAGAEAVDLRLPTH